MIKINDTCLLSLVTSRTTIGDGYIVGSVQKEISTTKAASYLYGEAIRLLSSMKIDIVQERIFAHPRQRETILNVRKSTFQKVENTLSHELYSYIDCNPVFDRDFAGFILRVAPREKVQTILYEDTPCGKKWFDGTVQHIILQNLTGIETAEKIPSREVQVRNMFYRADLILRASGGSYRDVVRTWFYLSDILDWYGSFNSVRSSVYEEFGLLPSIESSVLTLPSSTGIGVNNTQKLAGLLDLYAIIGPKTCKPPIEQLSNRGQKNAYEYGSAFSRGTVINNTGSKSMQLSGTAAINQKGISLFHNSCKCQIDFTFKKIHQLLRPLSASLKDICAATAFLKNRQDIPKLKSYLSAHGLTELPCVYVAADICRPELLFELDGELLFT